MKIINGLFHISTILLQPFKIAVLKLGEFCLPQNRIEKLIFFIFFFIYTCLSSYLVFNSSIIDNTDRLFNLYFGFDTQNFVNNFYSVTSTTHLGDAAHPFFRIIMLPIILVATFIGKVFGLKMKTMFLVLVMSSFVSGSLILILRYLSEFIKINKWRSIFLTVITGFFSTSLILSFTPESFTISMYLLTFTFVYSSITIKKEGRLPFIQFSLLVILTCGTTITNVIKSCLPELISEISLFQAFKRISFLTIILIVGLIVYYIGFIKIMTLLKGESNYSPLHDVFNQYMTYSNDANYTFITETSFFDKVLCYFFGTPILFGGFTTEVYFNFKFLPEINIQPYSLYWQKGVVISMVFTMIISLIQNYKQPFFLILIGSFMFDVFIHVGLRFGLNESFIYGGHWVFLIPLIYGWLYSSLKTKIAIKLFDYFLLIIGITLVINNSIRSFEFIDLASKLFPL